MLPAAQRMIAVVAAASSLAAVDGSALAAALAVALTGTLVGQVAALAVAGSPLVGKAQGTFCKGIIHVPNLWNCAPNPTNWREGGGGVVGPVWSQDKRPKRPLNSL